MGDFILEHMGTIIGIAVPVVLVGGAWLSVRRARRAQEMSAEKAEAFFKASFPELQPHLHPQAVATYVAARAKRQGGVVRERWDNPPGFGFASRAAFANAPKGEKTTLLDATGRRVLDFVLEPKAGTLGALRVGAGKFTVRQKPGEPPRVSYWHPEREFEWRGPGRWIFRSRLADEPIDTRDTSWSSSNSYSSWSSSPAAEPFEGKGGTFDGGGASGGWDDASGASDRASSTSY